MIYFVLYPILIIFATAWRKYFAKKEENRTVGFTWPSMSQGCVLRVPSMSQGCVLRVIDCK